MILQEFDKNKDAVINPNMFNKKIEGFPTTAVSFFSHAVMEEFVRQFNPKEIASIDDATLRYPIYEIEFKGCKLAVYQSPVGAPACAMNMEDVIELGAKNFLLVGCCGCLDKEIEDYGIIIPTSAIRDEGTSYHYMPESEENFIDPKCVELLEEVMKEAKIKYKKGKTWSTDAFYRETKEKLNSRIKMGAITVDMECSAMIAISNFRNVNFAQIFYGADNLGGEEYDPRSLMDKTSSENKFKIIPLALECGVKLSKNL